MSIIRQCPEIKDRILAIGITGQMHGIVPIDKDGNALCNAIIWADSRCEEEVKHSGISYG